MARESRRSAGRLPAGLDAHGRDFDALAPALANAGAAKRRVIAIDLRGRGQSEYDKNPENYNVAVELGDVVTILAALGIGPAVFVGSSRGGLLTMLLAVAHPTAIAGAVLHDIGPVIEPTGTCAHQELRRQAAAAAQLRRRRRNPAPPVQRPISEADRRGLAGRGEAWMEDYRWRAGADLRCADCADAGRARHRPPAADDVGRIRRARGRAGVGHPRRQFRHPVGGDGGRDEGASIRRMEIIEVPDQGHVPLLVPADLLQKIAAFVAACDARCQARPN